jgi:hypothetical protein
MHNIQMILLHAGNSVVIFGADFGASVLLI